MGGFTIRRLQDAASSLFLSFLLALGASAGTAETTVEDPPGDSGRTSESAPAIVPDPWTREAPALEKVETSKRVAPKAKAADRVSGIDAVDVGGGVLVHVVADGKIGLTRTRSLENPPRLVVDLPGLKTDPARHEISLESEWVRSVTLSSLPGRLRLELEGANENSDFSDRRVVPAADGLWVAIGDSPKLEEAMNSARQGSASLAKASSTSSTPVLEPGVSAVAASDEVLDTPGTQPPGVIQRSERAAEPQGPAETTAQGQPANPEKALESSRGSTPAEVVGVKYSPQPDRERIVVLARSPLTYEVRNPNPDTVVIRLPGAVIAADAAGRIEPPSGGSIDLVTSFQQPEVSPKEVRIVVKTAAGVSPELSSKGSLLFIDFPKQAPVARSSTKGEAGDSSVAAEGRDFVEKFEPMLGASQDREPRSVRRANAALDSEWERAAAQPFERRSAAAVPASASVAHPSQLLHEGGLSEGKVYRGRRISLDFKDVPVSDVLRLVAEVSNLNVVAGDEVKGKVTIRMMDVPWDQALDVILMTKGLGFLRVGNVIRIAPNDVLKAEAEVRLQERRNREKLEDLIVKIHPVNYADVAEAGALVERLLTERGSVNQDQRTSTLIIKDIPSVVQEAIELVDAIDTQTPQVLIEAKIVEANLDFVRELGSEWSIGTQPYADAFDPTSGHNPNLGGKNFMPHGNNALAFANPINGIPTGTAALSAFLLDDKLNLEVTLKAREAAGESKTVSSPRIVTMDNRKALIEQGVSIPFQTFEQGDAKLEFVDAVLSLTVTPHITSDESIIMDLELTRNAPSDTPNATGSPSIRKNVAKTETLVRAGQTLVLGGIYTVEKADTKKAVPYLSRIPILGGAFQSKSVRDERKELLMFVTPRIVRDLTSG